MSDLVNHPSHYEEQSIKLEPIDFCERLPFCEGNAIKYCFRAGHKDGASELLDLKKAQWYLNRWENSRKNLQLSEEEITKFREFLYYLVRAKGVLGEAAKRYIEGGCTGYGCFWRMLGHNIKQHLKVLETDKAIYDQTIGSKE